MMFYLSHKQAFLFLQEAISGNPANSTKAELTLNRYTNYDGYKYLPYIFSHGKYYANRECAFNIILDKLEELTDKHPASKSAETQIDNTRDKYRLFLKKLIIVDPAFRDDFDVKIDEIKERFSYKTELVNKKIRILTDERLLLDFDMY